MKSFAYLINPLSLDEARRFWPVLRFVPDPLAGFFITKSKSPFKALRVNQIRCTQGKRISGHIIVDPILGGLDEYRLTENILTASHIAERLGASMLGIDCCSELLGGQSRQQLTRYAKVPVSDGSALLSWSVVESVYRVARTKGVDLKKSTACVVGAGTAIGSLCARKISELCAAVILCDKDQQKSAACRQVIGKREGSAVSTDDSVARGMKNAQVIICADSLCSPWCTEGLLAAGTIVCDVTRSGSVHEKARHINGIVAVRGGLVKIPYATDLEIDFGLPHGIVPAALAETMLLTLENKFVNYSLGEDTNPDKMEEIANIAARRGFEVWAPEAPIQ